MIAHLEIVVLMALVATGAYEVQQDGMILHWLTKAWKKLPTFWQKPLWTCPVCMCSVWGIPVWFTLASFPLWHLPIHLFAAAGLAAYINR